MTMKNGYYLSCYLEIDPIGNLYDYAHRHDQNIALWNVVGNRVELMHYWELERLSGKKKHQSSLFSAEQFQSIMNDLLKEYDLSMENIIDVIGTPGLGASDEYLSIKRYPDFTYHTMCHLSSCIFMDMEKFKKEDLLAFAVDGGSDIVADKDTIKRKPFVGCYSKHGDGELNLFPAYSPAILWDYMSSIYEMQEGSLMALASASKSVAYYECKDILLNSNINVDKSVYEQIDRLVAYVDALSTADEGIRFNKFDQRFTEKENKISMVMKIIQQMSINIMCENINMAVEQFGIDTKETFLALSGGFTLNCPSNSYILKKYQFKGFLAPPCVSDSGMALGIGLYFFFSQFSGNFDFHFNSAYYGDSDNLDNFLKKNDYKEYIESVQAFDDRQVVLDIQEDPVIWFEGRAEVGPRALGARSIIGDPRQKRIKDRLNEIKIRQWWRPVAPIVLKDRIKDWFEEDQDSPYMLHAIRIKEEKKGQVAAIVHEDGSARLQSIDETSRQSKLYEVIRRFYQETGVPIICNTSLNDKGEPIINTIEEAINFALRKHIKIMYVNGYRLSLKNQDAYQQTRPLERPLQLLICDKGDLQAYIDEYNPYHLSIEPIFYYIYLKVNNYMLLRDVRESKAIKIRARLFMNTINPFFRADLKKSFQRISKEVLQ